MKQLTPIQTAFISAGCGPMKSRHVFKILNDEGFNPIRQRGSHIFFEHNDGRTVTVPNHHTIKTGTLRSIAEQSGIDFDEYC